MISLLYVDTLSQNNPSTPLQISSRLQEIAENSKSSYPVISRDIHSDPLCGAEFLSPGSLSSEGRGLIALCESHCVGGLMEKATNTHHLRMFTSSSCVWDVLLSKPRKVFVFLSEIGYWGGWHLGLCTPLAGFEGMYPYAHIWTRYRLVDLLWLISIAD